MEDKLDMIIIKQSQEEIEAYRGGILISALGGIVSVIVDVDILFWYCIAMGLYFFRWSVIINYILILGKDGVIVEKKKNKKYYSWDEFATKRVNCYTGYGGSGKAVIFSKYKYIQGQGILPAMYQFINPNLLIEIPVAKEMIKPEEDGSFVRCIDENVLSEKLQEWHVELEGDELGRPPWKKIF